MKRIALTWLILAGLTSVGCCRRPWWCDQDGYYGQPYYGPPQTYQGPVYPQQSYSPQPGMAQNPCTCY